MEDEITYEIKKNAVYKKLWENELEINKNKYATDVLNGLGKEILNSENYLSKPIKRRVPWWKRLFRWK